MAAASEEKICKNSHNIDHMIMIQDIDYTQCQKANIYFSSLYALSTCFRLYCGLEDE